MVWLSGCLVVCIAYTFNKITKPQNHKTTILNIDVLLKDKPTKSVHFFHISAKDNHLLTTNWYSIGYESIVFRLQKHSYWEVITMLLQPNIYVIASWKLSHGISEAKRPTFCSIFPIVVWLSCCLVVLLFSCLVV